MKSPHSLFPIPHSSRQGFTIIEMIVAVSIFTIVLLVAMSTFLAVVNSDHKSRAMRIATDNLNLALEDMSRKIKTGSTYSCGGDLGTNDCQFPSTSSVFAFTSQDGISRVIYKRGVGSGAIINGAVTNSGCGDTAFGAAQGCILREDSGFSMLATSPEIDITSLRFYISGSKPLITPDEAQPVVTIAIDGILGANAALFAGNAGFKIQTTVTQRGYDN
ncbi:MAG: type II secretion system protein [Candidatus Yonathbacteria bacterium]|nr:type II secretion system protein [Candidatus Yonathbacteria bacterium]